MGAPYEWSIYVPKNLSLKGNILVLSCIKIQNRPIKVADIAARVLVGTPDENNGGSYVRAATGDNDPWVENRGKLRCTSASPRTYPPDADGEGCEWRLPLPFSCAEIAAGHPRGPGCCLAAFSARL